MDFKSDSVHFVIFVLVPLECISCEQLILTPGWFGCFVLCVAEPVGTGMWLLEMQIVLSP